MGVLVPKDIKTKLDFVEDFDEIYATRIVPLYGEKGARWWVRMQVLSTAIVILRDTAVKFWGRGKKRAR